MGAVRLRVRAELRDRAWSWAGLALVVALVGGVVLALAAGARRTDTAYARFLERYPASDYTIAESSGFFTPSLDLEQVRDLPQVAQAARVRAYIAPHAETVGGRVFPVGTVIPFAPLDPEFGRSVERWKIVEGRRADPRRLDELVVGFGMASSTTSTSGRRLRSTSSARTPSSGSHPRSSRASPSGSAATHRSNARRPE